MFTEWFPFGGRKQQQKKRESKKKNDKRDSFALKNQPVEHFARLCKQNYETMKSLEWWEVLQNIYNAFMMSFNPNR